MNSGSLPLVSVCIPVYNCERFVGCAIESALAQTFSDFELIVIDNHSDDETLSIARRYEDPRLRIMQNESNIGAEANWNKAISLSQGKYVKILCADDYLYPNCLERQVAVLDADSARQILLVSCKRDIVDDMGQRIMTRGFPGRAGAYSGHAVIRKAVARATNILGEPPCVLFRADAIAAAGRFDASIPYVVDLDFYFRVLLNGKAYFQNETLSAFRISRGSWSLELSRLQADNFVRFIDRLQKDGRFRLTALDRLQGRVMCRVNALLRQLVYRWLLRTRSSTDSGEVK